MSLHVCYKKDQIDVLCISFLVSVNGLGNHDMRGNTFYNQATIFINFEKMIFHYSATSTDDVIQWL